MISRRPTEPTLLIGIMIFIPFSRMRQDVERLALTGDLGVLDAHHLTHALARIHGLVARLEAGLHL